MECTLYDLVQGLSELTTDEYELLAGVVLLVNSGRVRLQGPFADTPLILSTPLFSFPAWLRPALREYQPVCDPRQRAERPGRGRARKAA
jgi:hypothetical protein